MLSGVYPMHAHTHAFVILNVCHALVDGMEGHACLLCVCTPVCAMYVYRQPYTQFAFAQEFVFF